MVRWWVIALASSSQSKASILFSSCSLTILREEYPDIEAGGNKSGISDIKKPRKAFYRDEINIRNVG